ncbi:MAG: TolB family protein, partial [Bryobacteraceae bacterium]
MKRVLSAATLIALAGAVVVREITRVRAADADVTTWGAADPTWSPDGLRLAFALFGGIWVVPVQGGEAEQITSSPGYHAHPAW